MSDIVKLIQCFVASHVQPYTIKYPNISEEEHKSSLLMERLKESTEEDKTLATLILDRHVTETEKEAEKMIQDAIDARDTFHLWLEMASK